MRCRHHAVLALAAVSLAVGCADNTDDGGTTRSRTPNSVFTAQGVGAQGMGPNDNTMQAPKDMPGGGRQSNNPKGK